MSSVLEKLNVLFICTGNTCRSQIAEALLRAKAGEFIEAYSAGSDPEESVNPFAIAVMNELGISMNGHYPKDISEFYGNMTLHYVITVCDSAAEKCTEFWQKALNRLHWHIEDPADFLGASDEEAIAKYREVRDLIAARIDEWLLGSIRSLRKR